MDRKNNLPINDDYRVIGRRDFFRQWGPPAAAGVALAGLGFVFSDRPGRHRAPEIE